MIPVLILILATVLYRVGLAYFGASSNPGGSDTWGNFCPVAALVLCSAAWIPSQAMSTARKWMWVMAPYLALLVSDLLLNAHYGVALISREMIIRYAAFAGATCIGLALGGTASLGRLIAGSIVGSLFFYLLTNSASWIADPAYPQTFAGWVQAMTVGLPGLPPTWMFFRNTLAGDLLYTLMFAGCMVLGARKVQPELAHDGEPVSVAAK